MRGAPPLSRDLEPLHTRFKRLLSIQPDRLVWEGVAPLTTVHEAIRQPTWRRAQMEASVKLLQWAVASEVAILVGVWPDEAPLCTWAQANPLRACALEIIVTHFWLGKGSETLGHIQLSQEMRELFDRFWIWQKEWQRTVPACLTQIHEWGESHGEA